MRKHRYCELTLPPDGIIERFTAQALRLQEEVLAAEAKVIRLRKQRRLIQKKFRDLGDKEMQNILKMEAEEALKNAPPLKPFSDFSFFSLSQVSQGFPNRTLASPFRSK